ncbi:amino acid ABC transporter permease [Leucobacter sp. HY1910]
MTFIEFLPRLLDGLVVSLQLTGISVAAGYMLGMLFALGTSNHTRWIKIPCLVLVEVGRGIPALVVLYMVYFGLPAFGLLLENFWAASLALTYTAAAYSSEIMRSGIQSVAKGQREAANALGLKRTATFLRIILPQGLRSAIPALMGLAIMSFQGTSLAYTISVNELMSQAYQVSMITFEYLNIYMLTGLIYVAFALPVMWIVASIEKRMARQAV